MTLTKFPIKSYKPIFIKYLHIVIFILFYLQCLSQVYCINCRTATEKSCTAKERWLRVDWSRRQSVQLSTWNQSQQSGTVQGFLYNSLSSKIILLIILLVSPTNTINSDNKVGPPIWCAKSTLSLKDYSNSAIAEKPHDASYYLEI